MLAILTQLRISVERFRGLGKDARGTTTVEYAIMLVLVAIAVATTAPGISGAILTVFTNTVTALGGATP